jgi:hypothetical protein
LLKTVLTRKCKKCARERIPEFDGGHLLVFGRIRLLLHDPAPSDDSADEIQILIELLGGKFLEKGESVERKGRRVVIGKQMEVAAP